MCFFCSNPKVQIEAIEGGALQKLLVIVATEQPQAVKKKVSRQGSPLGKAIWDAALYRVSHLIIAHESMRPVLHPLWGHLMTPCPPAWCWWPGHSSVALMGWCQRCGLTLTAHRGAHPRLGAQAGCCSSAGGRGGDARSRQQAQRAASTGADIWKELIARARPAPCLWQWPAAEASQRGEQLREPPAKCAVLSVGLGDPSLPPRRAPQSVRSNYPRFGI